MRQLLACPMIAAAMLTACDKATPSQDAAPNSAANTTPSTTPPPAPPDDATIAASPTNEVPPAPTPSSAPDPFALGFCEVTRDGGQPEKTPGGMAAVSTMHWAGPATNNPPWPLMLNCGNINLSGAGTRAQFPMQPGNFPVLSMGEPDKAHFTVMAFPFHPDNGSVTIEAWDMLHIRGRFELNGRANDKPANIKGSFDFKCPYTKPGEPCLAAPQTTP